MSKMSSPVVTGGNEFRTILVKQDRRSSQHKPKWLMALAAGMLTALVSIMVIMCVTHMAMDYGVRSSGESDPGEQNHARGLVFNQGFFNPNVSGSGINTPPASLGLPLGTILNTAMTAEQMGTGTGAHVGSILTVTSTEFIVTNTLTITPDAAPTVAALSSVFTPVPSNADCTPVVVTVTQTVNPQAMDQPSSTSPFTTILISDLYTDVSKATSASQPIEAAGDVTVTVSERPTVLTTTTSTITPGATSTNLVGAQGISSDTPRVATVTLSRVVTFTFATSDNAGAATIATAVSTVFTTEVVGVEQTVYATGSGAISADAAAGTGYSADFNTMTRAIKPSTTESAAVATSSDLTSEGSRAAAKPTTGSSRGGTAITSCVVMMVATLLFVF